MNRIDLPHLVWALESLVEGRIVNPIRVDPEIAPLGADQSRSTRCSRCPRPLSSVEREQIAGGRLGARDLLPLDV
jgi:hypothetical protein